MFDVVLGQLAVVAVFVQRVIDFVKPLYQGSTYQKYLDMVLSVVASSLLCVAWGVDVFAVVEINFTWVWLGSVFTGVFAALGSNVLNDLLFLLKLWKEKQVPSYRWTE